MPTIPQYVRQESIPDLRGPTATPDEFGALIGVAAQRAGNDIDQAAEIIARRQQQLNDEKDSLDALNVSTALRTEWDKIENEEVFPTKGADAVGIYEKRSKAAKDLMETRINSLESEGARRKATAMVSPHYASHLNYISRHEAVERQTYKDQTIQGAIDVEIRNATRDPERLEKTIAISRGMIIDAYPGQETTHRQLAAQDNIVKSTLTSILDKNPRELQGYLNRHKDVLGEGIYQDYSDRAEKAVRALENEERIQKNQIRIEQELARKEWHDKEEREIGNLYMQGKYSDAFRTANKSVYLSGDEKRAWADAIDKETAPGKTKVDPEIEMQEIVDVTDMMIQDRPADEIKSYIIKSDKLSKANKEQYINMAQSKYAQQIGDIRKLSMEVARDVIIPKRGITEKFLSTPMENMAVIKAQNEIHSWLDEQYKANKRPTRQEATDMARRIAEQNQVTIVEQMQFLKDQAATIAAQSKAAQEKFKQEEAEKKAKEKAKRQNEENRKAQEEAEKVTGKMPSM